MRDPKRIPKVLKEIERLWKKYPDLRLGQLLINADIDYWMEEDDLLERLRFAYKEDN